MMRWITIDQQLPPVGGCVLFCCFFGKDDVYNTTVGMGYYQGQKTEGDAIAMETQEGDWEPCTHWMPLPPTPDKEQA